MRTPTAPPLLPWLDALALAAWGTLLLKFYFSGQLQLLIHPNYFGLCLLTGLILLLLAIAQAWRLRSPQGSGNQIQHLTLIKPGISSGILLVVALLGFVIPPTVLSSQTAVQRGLTASLPLTRTQPEAFRTNTRSQDRTIIDWVRTLNAYPEPDAYSGQEAKITGFVVKLPSLPENYVMLSRFILTCCAVDAYPVGIPVQLPPDSPDYEADAWLTIQGTMATQNLTLATQDSAVNDDSSDRQLVLMAETVEAIATPADPYNY